MHADHLTGATALASVLRGSHGVVTHALVDTARRHGVEALLAHTAAAASAPGDVAVRLHAIASGCALLASVRDGEVTRVLGHLHEAGVSPVLIKGAHLAHVLYPAPAMRPRGDTDLVIAEGERTAAASALLAAGYQRKVHVRGAVILGQEHFERTDGSGIVHALDVHWRIAAPLVLRHLLLAAVLRASRVALPALGPHAWGPRPAHALVVACVHLAAHHRDDPCLLWLYEIAALAAALPDEEAGIFLDTTRTAAVGAICTWALERARRDFDGPALSRLASRAASESVPGEPSARLLGIERPVEALWLDLKVAADWTERLTLLREHALPDPSYMRETHPGWLPFAYARRAFSGSGKWLSANASGRGAAAPDAPPAGSPAASARPSSAKTTR